MSDRVVTSHTHTHIATSPPAHRVTTLQGMEAMERGRGAAALDNIKIKKIYMLNHFFVEKFVLTNMFI